MSDERVDNGEGMRRKMKEKEIWRRMSRKLSGSSDEIEDVDSVRNFFYFFLKHTHISSTISQISICYMYSRSLHLLIHTLTSLQQTLNIQFVIYSRSLPLVTHSHAHTLKLLCTHSLT